jgi:hypothetical protein
MSSSRLSESQQFVMATLDMFWSETADFKAVGYIVIGVGPDGVLTQFLGPKKPDMDGAIALLRAAASALEEKRYSIR